jgi:hypothetical protein
MLTLGEQQSRCVWGGVVQREVDGSKNVFNDLSPIKARIALMLQLMRN